MMTQNSQRGASLIEVTLSASLIALVMTGLLTFTTRSIKILRHMSLALAPECDRPVCSLETRSSTCECGERTSIVIW